MLPGEFHAEMSDTTSSRIYDVAIVGMGPGGAVAAAELSRGGLTVLAFDKDSPPRYKVCGGGLSARIAHVLELNLESVVERTIYGVQFAYRGQEPLLIQAASPIAYMVMRDRFDHHLGQEARRAGAEIREGEGVIGLVQQDDAVEVTTSLGRYRARFVVGADGANSCVARQLFPESPPCRVPALESEILVGDGCAFPPSGTIVVDVGAVSQGYGWIFPKHGRLSIGVGEFRLKSVGLRATFDRFVQRLQGLKELSIPRPVGHPIPVYSSGAWTGTAIPRRLVNGRALLVGDAGHLVDPLFGEGIYYAVRSGQLAAQAILRAMHDRGRTVGEYEGEVERELVPDFRVTARIARVIYTFPHLCFKLLGRYQDVVQLYFEVLQGRVTAEQFLGQAKRRMKRSVSDLLLEALQLR